MGPVFVPLSIVSAFWSALGTILVPEHLALVLLAALAGLVLGVTPGIGGLVGFALLIPLTFGMDPLLAFMILAGMLGGFNFGGSITAILLNTPGTPPNAATILDGYPMTRNGEAGRAIGASATASALGAVVGLVVLLLTIPIMREVVLLFGTPEIFWLSLWGLAIVAIVTRGNMVKGLISAGLGMLFMLHGLNNMTNTLRWTYGYRVMESGIGLIPLLVGLFAVSEMIKLLYDDEPISGGGLETLRGRKTGILDVWNHKSVFFKGSIVGVLIGTIPAVGGTVANFLSYYVVSNTSADKDRFGEGDVRGVIASEASNDAKDGGSLIPTLGFGIPGSAATAVLLGAFTLHGITPGPTLMLDHLDVVLAIVLGLLASNIFTSLCGIVAANKLVRITAIDINLISPMVILVAYVGAYSINFMLFDMLVVLFSGILGYVMIQIDMSRVPLIIAFVLGPVVEQHFFRSLQISGGEYDIFVGSPLSIFLVVLVGLSLLSNPMIDRLKRRHQDG